MTSVNPVRFHLADKDGHPWLFAPDPEGRPPETVVFTVENRSGHDIALNKLDDTSPGPKNYHFCLHFRPGTLSEDTKEMLADDNLASEALLGEQADDWRVAIRCAIGDDGTDEIYFVYLGQKLVLSADTPFILNLLDFTADGSQRPRSTNVEFRLTNAHYTGEQTQDYRIDAAAKSYLHLWSVRPKAEAAAGLGDTDGLAFFLISGNELSMHQINDDLEFMVCNTTDETIGAAGDHLTFSFAPPGTATGGRLEARFQPNEVYLTLVEDQHSQVQSKSTKTPLECISPDSGRMGDGDSYQIALPDGGLSPQARITIKGWCGGAELSGPLLCRLDSSIAGAAPTRHCVTLMRVEKTLEERLSGLEKALARIYDEILPDLHQPSRETQAMMHYLNRKEFAKSLEGMRDFINTELTKPTLGIPKPPPGMIVDASQIPNKPGGKPKK